MTPLCRRSFPRAAATIAALLLAAASACAAGAPPPAPLDTRHESCAWCRMSVSSQRFAAQIVAPAEEPLFFDDLGCLRDWLAGGGAARLAKGAIAYVADHRTGDWVPAASAVYVRVGPLETPMGSHLLAHADAASRAADDEAKGGEPLAAAEVFGGAVPPRGTP